MYIWTQGSLDVMLMKIYVFYMNLYAIGAFNQDMDEKTYDNFSL